MADPDPRRLRRAADALPLPDTVALVLQGGGALGSYQAGVIEALGDSGIAIDWVAGISIGAVNAAIVAGNPPERRIERLRAFWNKVTAALPSFPIPLVDQARELVHEWSAAMVLAGGVPGFFRPRPLPPALAAPGTPEALSFYDSTPLKETLDELVDWDLLNSGPVRLSVGAVELESGNFRALRHPAGEDGRACGRSEPGEGTDRKRMDARPGREAPCRRPRGARRPGPPGTPARCRPPWAARSSPTCRRHRRGGPGRSSAPGSARHAPRAPAPPRGPGR